MDKAVYTGGILIALALIAGSVFIPSSLIMTLASTSVWAIVARVVIIGLMVGLIVSNPPRSHTFRAVLAVASIGFLTWAVQHAMNGTIQLADSLLYLQAAISFGIEALESDWQRNPLDEDEVNLDDVKSLRGQIV